MQGPKSAAVAEAPRRSNGSAAAASGTLSVRALRRTMAGLARVAKYTFANLDAAGRSAIVGPPMRALRCLDL